MLTNFYDPKNICSFFRQWIMHFFVSTISNHRLSLSNESSKTINPFIPEISVPAREEPDQLLPKRERKKKESRDVVSSSQFLELIDSSFNTESSLPDKGQSSEFYSFAAFPSRSLHTLLFFPRKQPILTDPRFHHYFPSRFLIIVLFLREIESSPISSQLRQLLIYPTATGNRSFCRNGFHPPSIFVSFRLIDLSPRIFVSPVRCRSPGREAGGGRRGLGHASTNDRPFFASCRVSPGSYTLPNRERDIIRRDPRPLEF